MREVKARSKKTRAELEELETVEEEEEEEEAQKAPKKKKRAKADSQLANGSTSSSSVSKSKVTLKKKNGTYCIIYLPHKEVMLISLGSRLRGGGKCRRGGARRCATGQAHCSYQPSRRHTPRKTDTFRLGRIGGDVGSG